MSDSNKYYSGIGSRETPDDIIDVMKQLGKKLADQGWILRTGGAKGADQAFELGWIHHVQYALKASLRLRFTFLGMVMRSTLVMQCLGVILSQT